MATLKWAVSAVALIAIIITENFYRKPLWDWSMEVIP
jgi:hypothetical protein